ncbi:AraC family transcriptional regulator [Aquitalea aquatica]|nr:AraC family transcriptional regulator [Aquitalea magnusonii]
MTESCTDRLNALLQHFPVHARMFHSGSLCGITDFTAAGAVGQLHLIRSGAMEIIHPGQPTLYVNEPSLLFYPRPMARRFITDPVCGADLTCAELHFAGGSDNPIVNGLPDVICLPLETIDGAAPVLALLFEEAFSERCGRHALIDKLFEVVLIQLLRQLMESKEINGGMLAGLSHPKLRKALVAMHEQPGQEWSLDALATIAGMSRSVFASSFRHTVGSTPGAYLQNWRVRLTQQALQRGESLKMIAIAVGYGSEAALSRAFKAQCGLSPREWRQLREQDTPG